MADLKTLKQLIQLMVQNDLTELDLEGEGEKIKLKRGNHQQPVQYVAPPAAPPSPPAPAGGTSAGNSEPDANAGLVPIPSPMVGTFYAAPSPDTKPFVNVGDRVSADTVVCIIEAMKVFNEIKAEASGTIQRVAATSGQSVEYNQPLFLIRPD